MHSEYEAVNCALRGRVAASALPRAVQAGGKVLDRYLAAIKSSKLRRLSVSFKGCDELTTAVAARLIEALPQTLVELKLSALENIKALPEAIGHLTLLQRLTLPGMRNIEALPESIGHLTALRLLSLSSCGNLKALPQSFSKLTSLLSVNLSHCGMLAVLPDLSVLPDLVVFRAA